MALKCEGIWLEATVVGVVTLSVVHRALPFEELHRAPSFAFGRAIFLAPRRWNFFL